MAPTTPKRSRVVMTPSGEHVVRGGRYDCLVANAECARTPIPDAPLPPPSQETHLRIGGLSRFLLPTFLCGGKEK
jgi:hypothetical protein